jgi:hypothetical protein
MGDIISLNDKLGLSDKKKQSILKRRKYLAFQKMFQCSRCAVKCDKCGVLITEVHQRRLRSDLAPKLPYRFCEGCMEEYLDFIARLQGTGNPDFYWHNAAWMEGWNLWIDYQGAIDRYVNSVEFKRLVQEIKSDPDEA